MGPSASKRQKNMLLGSILLIVLGGMALVGAAGIGVFSEIDAHTKASAIQEGSAQVRSVDSKKISSANEGKLVCVKDKVTAPDLLRDNDFAIALNVVKLQRNVSKYQWVETEKSSRTMDKQYDPEWGDELVDSHKFVQEPGHHNSPTYTFPPIKNYAKNASLGAFRLSSEIIDSMPTKPYPIAKTANVALMPAYRQHKITVEDEHFYVGKDPSIPNLGDERISFEQVLPFDYTIVAKQKGGQLVPFETQSGSTIALSKPGFLTAQDVFKIAKDETEQNLQKGRVFAAVAAIFGLAFLGGGVFSMIWTNRNPDKIAPVVKRGQMTFLVISGVMFVVLGISAICMMGFIALPVVIISGLGYALVATLVFLRNRQ